MKTRLLVGIPGLLLIAGAVAAQVARIQSPERALMRVSVREEAIRRHDFRQVPRYAIRLKVDGDLTAYSAEQTVTLTNTTGTSLREVVFLLYPNATFLTGRGGPNLTVTSASVNGAPVTATASGAQLVVPLPAALAPERQTAIQLKFQSRVPSMPVVHMDSAISLLRDLLRSLLKTETNYGVFGVGERVLNLGHWFPMVAHHDGKNWDRVSPSGVGDVAHFEVAHYDVTIDAPAQARVATTGVEQSSLPQGDRRVSHYVAGAVRDFAIQMSPRYAKLSRTVDGITVNSHYLTEHKAVGAQVLEVAARSLAYFNRTIGPYPYRELDLVEAPLASIVGGMEHPGLVTINQMLYDMGGMKLGKLGDPELDRMLAHFDGLSENMLAFVVAHEVAHQWWNAVVGSDSKRHPFLDEALANHSARMVLESIRGKQVADQQAFLNIEMTYHLHRLMGGQDRALDLPARAYGGTTEYAAIIYGKGALFFEALQQQMGTERFQRLLQRYYDRYQFRLASPEDLLGSAREVSPAPAATTALFRRWLEEARGDEDIGPIKLASAFEVLIEPLIGKGTPEAKFFRDLTRGLDGLVRDARQGKAELIDQLLAELEAALAGKPTKTESGVGNLLKALDELFKALEGAEPAA